jgi:hypothetical protein
MCHNSPDPHVLVCEDVHIDCNSAAGQMFQFERQEICGLKQGCFFLKSNRMAAITLMPFTIQGRLLAGIDGLHDAGNG